MPRLGDRGPSMYVARDLRAAVGVRGDAADPELRHTQLGALQLSSVGLHRHFERVPLGLGDGVAALHLHLRHLA